MSFASVFIQGYNIPWRKHGQFTKTAVWLQAPLFQGHFPNIAYHLRKIFEDAELDMSSVIKEILITGPDGKNYRVNHYNLQVIIALGFKIDNERAIAFRKWANQIVSQYTIRGYVLDKPQMKEQGNKNNEDWTVHHPLAFGVGFCYTYFVLGNQYKT